MRQPVQADAQLSISFQVGAALVFSLIGGAVSERYGRKPTILLASVIFTAGAVVMGVAVEKWTLLTGRLVVGAGIGLASMSVPIYISEASPPSIRGLLVSCNVLVTSQILFLFLPSCIYVTDVSDRTNACLMSVLRLLWIRIRSKCSSF